MKAYILCYVNHRCSLTALSPWKQVSTPEAGMKVAKEVIIELYEGAQRALGTYAPVPVPPPLLLQDPEVRKKIIWQVSDPSTAEPLCCFGWSVCTGEWQHW
jgi:hypothetical protein